jgi:hypothetical protein
MVEVVNATLVVVIWPEDVVGGRSIGEECVEVGSKGPVAEGCWFDSVGMTVVEKGATVEEDEGTNDIVDELEIEMPDELEIGEVDCNSVLVSVDVVAAREVDPVGTEGGAEGMTELEPCPID